MKTLTAILLSTMLSCSFQSAQYGETKEQDRDYKTFEYKNFNCNPKVGRYYGAKCTFEF